MMTRAALQATRRSALCFLLPLWGLLLVGGSAAADDIDFNRDVRPILSDRCFKCHGPDAANQDSEFRVDTFAHATADLGGYFGVVPGDLDASVMHARIHDPDDPMPPRDALKQLTEKEKAILDQWILQGARFDSHWAFKPLPEVVPIPDAGRDWARGPMDRFIAQGHQQQGLTPAAEAPREKWLRRVTFDLTGLPPTLEEIDNFLQDASPEAYQRVVDRLLDSEACAERLTSEWLDVARYSDTYGYQRDDERFVWPYRDWVIRAFRSRMPYDQFIRWQLAGDLLPDATVDQRLATTFNRLHSHKKEGGVAIEEFRVEYVADRVHTVAAAFLGLTMECSRCHDHKYDPLTMTDYYSLAAFFDNIDERGLISFFTAAVPTPSMPLPNPGQQQAIDEATRRLAEVEARWQKHLETEFDPAFEQWLANREPAVPASGDAARTGDASETGDGSEANPRSEPVETAEGGDTSEGGESSEAEPLDDAPTPASGLPKGLVVDLPLDAFEEVSAEEAKNETGGKVSPESMRGLRNHAGKLAVTPVANRIVEGRVGGAIELSGDDAVVIPEAGRFPRHQPFTVSLWIWSPEVDKRGVIYRRSRGWDDAGSIGYELTKEGGILSAKICHFWPGDAIAVETVEPIEANRWIHVTVAYDGSSRAAGLRIFVDGKPADTVIVEDHLTRNITNWSGGYPDLAIGSRYRDRGFAGGRVDAFRVFERELSGLEVAQLFDGHSLHDLLNKPTAELAEHERTQLREHFRLAIDASCDQMREELREARAARNGAIDATPAIMVMREDETPRQTYVLARGEYDQPTDPVSPATPTCLPPMSGTLPKNRLGLADWLTDPDHPLTARVTVNRYWQLMFGSGLVRTPEDFGNQGENPTHPELLDWLARDFVASGWDVHRLLKQIALSATYRQSSVVTPEQRAKDPENRFLARGTNQRLSAEMIRDNALATSGLLVEQVGGPPVKPYDVALAYTPLPVDQGEKLYRRSLYTFWKRTSPAPVMMTLNTPTREVCRLKREITNTPLQALVLLNGPQFIEAARVMAAKLLDEHDRDIDAVIRVAFQRLTSRVPTDREQEILRQLYREQLEHFNQQPDQASELLKVGQAKVDTEVADTTLAAATVLVNSIMNLDECVRHQ